MFVLVVRYDNTAEVDVVSEVVFYFDYDMD